MSDRTRAGVRDPISEALAACDEWRMQMVPGARYEAVLPAMERAARATLLAMHATEGGQIAQGLLNRRMLKLMEQQQAENARLRRAVRVLAKLQRDARVREAMMEVLSDAR